MTELKINIYTGKANWAKTYILACVALLSISCTSTKKSTYFYDTPDSNFRVRTVEGLEPVLQESDLLSISVNSVNPNASELFNSSNVIATQSSTISGKISQVSGFLIDQDGFIKYPVLGKIKAAGKTKKELTEEITSELENRKLLIEPIVTIRYLNFNVSVLGEVANPSVLTIPNEKISLLEALGLAGDITIFGNKDNVVLIREENGVRNFRRLDLTTTEIFNSPYYYLKSNDIIYVEPNKAMILKSSQTTQWIPVVLSAMSLAIVAIFNLR